MKCLSGVGGVGQAKPIMEEWYFLQQQNLKMHKTGLSGYTYPHKHDSPKYNVLPFFETMNNFNVVVLGNLAHLFEWWMRQIELGVFIIIIIIVITINFDYYFVYG